MYKLISIRLRYFVCIKNRNEINEILRAHNSGIGSQTSHLLHTCLYSAFAYICGFNGSKNLMYFIEHKCKENVRRLRSQVINNPHIWSRIGGNKFLNLDLSNYGVSETMSELLLILFFRLTQLLKIFAISLGWKILCDACLYLIFVNHYMNISLYLFHKINSSF